MKKQTLLVNSSARKEGSITRQVAEKLATTLVKHSSNGELKYRDTAEGLPFIDQEWIGANFTAPEDREAHHKDALALSDNLVEELQNTDTLVIATPIYNFGIPASLKAWIDLIARARLTFKYTENGPVGLLENKKAYVVIASGGVEVGGEYDFVSPYLKHVLGFIGITDVTIVNANTLNLEDESALAGTIEALV